jgi:spore germination cell wall hydrolase CwlJ-like protein
MSKSTFGKIACAISAAAVLAALQMSAPAIAANQPNDQPAIVLPALTPPVVQPAEAESPEQTATVRPAADPAQIECMAKVIIHEAGNQPRKGRAAVAQVIRARTQDPRFATKPCAVIRQPGQFFDVDAYNPPRNDQWREAVEIATQVINGEGDNPVPGALFFHAASSPMKGRTQVARIEGHVFYR